MKTFYQVLTDAVRDIALRGYQDPAQLAEWLKRLRFAAIANLPSLEEQRNQMQLALGNYFKRSTSKAALLRTHPGVSKFTADRLSPQMRVLLDQRIFAAADLIKLNREQSIEKTLQRFSGWATSIPSGGSRAVEVLDVKEHIGKPLKKVRWEQRRLEIDQGHKLMASVSAVIAEQTGAIAMIWRSNWRQPGYDYRPDHKERDKHVYLLRGNWAQTKGLVKPGKSGYLDEITQVAEEPFCRCFGVWITSLRDLPEDMLTQKGKQALAKVA